MYPLVLWRRIALLGGCCLWLAGCSPTIVGPTMPSGYRIRLPETSQTLRLHPLPLTVQVTDARGMPANDVEVSFRVPPQWAAQVYLDPPQVITQQGQATTTLRAQVAGRIDIEISVEDRTATVPVVILGDSPRF